MIAPGTLPGLLRQATYRPSPPRQPRPLEHVWSLWKNGHRKDCGLYFYGENYGWECQLRDDGFLEFGQRFIFKEAALRLARELRVDLEREGWSLQSAD
jgi:hypothetical protein